MNGAEIIPAVLPEDEAELRECFGSIKGAAREIHLDICDGIFTPERSWPRDSEEEWRKFVSSAEKEEGLPFWEDFDFEIHLMTRKSEAEAELWLKAGASRIIVHTEAVSDSELDAVAGLLKDRAELGLALRLETPIDELKKRAEKINFVHLMSIPDLGYQGSSFDERIFDKIKEVRDLYPDLVINIDGGVCKDNVRKLSGAGARRLIAGSAIFASGEPKKNYEELLKELE